ncbi:MAG: sigma-70 family RNA polymerase sigma factor [Planctomycetota bacterium]|nr:sigma-70 family RNA polymerase sigma factor [Planctomycetota bacterium]
MTEEGGEDAAGWQADPGVALMLRVQTGDTAAFEELVRAYQGAAFGMLRRILGPRGAVEDLAQEAFLRVWRGRDRFRPKGRFTTYLYRVTYNLALNRIRDNARKPLRPLPLDPEGRPLEAASPEEHPGLEPADQEIWADRIGQALQAIPENQRAALVFQHYDGLDLTEIASILEISPQAVKSLLHRARERLRELLSAAWNSGK